MNHFTESTGGIIPGVFGEWLPDQYEQSLAQEGKKMKMKRTFGIRLNDMLKNCSESIIFIFFTVFRCDEIGIF